MGVHLRAALGRLHGCGDGGGAVENEQAEHHHRQDGAEKSPIGLELLSHINTCGSVGRSSKGVAEFPNPLAYAHGAVGARRDYRSYRAATVRKRVRGCRAGLSNMTTAPAY